MAAANRPPARGGSRRRISGGLFALLPVALLASCLLIAAVLFAGTVVLFGNVAGSLADPADLSDNVASLSDNAEVYDRTGTIVLASFGSDRRSLIDDFARIPNAVMDATTAVEDKTFWTNSGFDPLGFVSAAFDTITGGQRGGSTITQQLVRNALLEAADFEGSVYARKVKEIIQAIRVTKTFPGDAGKEVIMRAYLNTNYYGARAYGILAAAQEYFGISDLSQLTLGQATLLAGIPQSPSAFDLRASATTDAAGLITVALDSPVAQRRLDVLTTMKNARNAGLLRDNTISDEAFAAAAVEPIQLIDPPLKQMDAPHYVDIIHDAASLLLCPVDQPSYCPNGIDVELATRGYKIVTALDWNMQQAAEKWAAAILSTQIGNRPNSPARLAYLASIGVKDSTWLRNMHKSQTEDGASDHNAAIVTMDARTGDMLAYAGSSDYYASENPLLAPIVSTAFQPQYDVLSGYRQPGSAIKPVVYGYALEMKAITPATMFMDVPVDFGQGWTPQEWDGRERGPVRMRQALQGSLNIPAIKTAIRAGADNIWRRMRDGAFRFRESTNIAGSSLAIGTLEIRYVDLLSAYGALANEGKMFPRRYILRIEKRDGTMVYEAPDPSGSATKIFETDTAALVTDILSGNTDPQENAIWAAARLKMPGGARRPAALKTGTSSDIKDQTAFGYLAPPSDPNGQQLVTGVWAGNSDSTPTAGLSLATAGSLWQSAFNEIARNVPKADFVAPNLPKITIDTFTGELPGPCTTRTMSEYFLPGTQPTTSCSTYVTLQIDTATGLVWNPSCAGPMETQTFLDVSLLETDYPKWQAANIEWAERARLGDGQVGGATGGITSYFYSQYWKPYGNTWGGTIAPTASCLTAPPLP